MASAEDVGKKLLGEVEECGFDELLHELRFQDESTNENYFKFRPIDQLLQATNGYKVRICRVTATQPMVELMSLSAGGGATHILYHLSALAVLPRAFGGREECVVIIDTDGKFSVPRLAVQIRLLLNRRPSNESIEPLGEDNLGVETTNALKHIHIFRPQSLISTIGTLDSLPDYLFNQDRHYSTDRGLAFICLDSASAFYWQDRSETENATFLAKTSPTTTSTQTSEYFRLASSFKTASKIFDCPVIFTSWYLGPQQKTGDSTNPRSFRPQLPPLQAILRLVVHRLPVRRFRAGLSLDGALREAQDRQKAVAEGRFECFVNEWSLDERSLRHLPDQSFQFRILDDGLWFEESKAKETQ